MGDVCGESSSISSQSLDLMIGALRNSGAHNFDPVRFSFILAMARRAREHGGAVEGKVNEAAEKALCDYRASFTLAKEEAGRLLERENTEISAELEALHQVGKFKEMKRLHERSRPIERNYSLSALTDYIAALEPIAKDRTAPGSFDDLLREQEQRLLQQVGDERGAGALTAASDIASLGEPNAIYHLREALVKRNADTLVTRLVEEIPDDAGPLNPQKLMVKSLSSMRDLSPHYMNRFVAYIDTLLWLEEAGG